jgi:hypothetical protein
MDIRYRIKVVEGSTFDICRSAQWVSAAQRKAESSRATAVTTCCFGLPRPVSRRKRRCKRCCACHACSMMARVAAAAARGRERGWCRYCHAASTRTRRQWALPVLVMRPRARVAPLEYSEGTSPVNAMMRGADGKRRASPSSAAMVSAVRSSIPRKQRKRSTRDRRGSSVRRSRSSASTARRRPSASSTART